MRITLTTAAALAVLAAACDISQPEQPTRQIVVRSEAQNRLHELNEMNLKIALRRAIYDSGATCPRVDEAGYVQEYGNLSMWTASCSNNRRWAIFVAPDGTAQLRDCRTMAELNLPECRISEGEAEPVDNAAG